MAASFPRGKARRAMTPSPREIATLICVSRLPRKAYGGLCEKEGSLPGSNDFDMRLESADHSATFEDDASSWLSAQSAHSLTSPSAKRPSSRSGEVRPCEMYVGGYV